MKGIYILQVKIKKNIFIKIGSKYKIYFQKGFYSYIGSAQNNLEKRILRHLKDSKNKKFHWHIDYLLNNPNLSITKVYYKKTNYKSEECKTAKRLSKNKSSIKNFGCSDCKCSSHLIKTKCVPKGFNEFAIN